VGEIVATYDLIASPLSRSGFEPFGEVIQIEGSRHYTINEGWAERYHDLACVDVTAAGGRPLINIFRARPRTLPLSIRAVERHALGSQAFIPLARSRFLVVVAPPGGAPKPSDLRAFITDGVQGVNYRPGVWHHPLLSLDQVSDFVVIDRGAAETDCEETVFDGVEITLRF
jgi:ureidoglycolate lyase